MWMESFMKTKPHKKFFRAGTTTVEAAIVLPIVLLVTFGALKYGWLFLKSQQITNAARQAARLAIRPGDRSALVLADITQQMDQSNIAGYTVTLTPGDGNPLVGDEVTVQITVPAANVDLLPLPFIPSPDSLGATITMSKEGAGSP
jgi:Flp pilus assembly protein TadG